jgi:3-dehydroquinate synthase
LWDDALTAREKDGGSAILRGLQEFREHLGGELHITQLRGIGRSFEVTEMDEAVVLESIDELRTAAAAQPRSRSFGASHRRR